MKKIDGLKFYLAITKSETLKQFFFEKFRQVDLQYINYYDERQYIEFYIEFKTELELKYEDILTKFISNISYFESVENLIFLKSVDEESFEEVLNDNFELFNDKVSDSIQREIELIDSENNLHYFKDVRLAELNLSSYSISLECFENQFIEKETKIREKEKSNKIEASPIKVEEMESNSKFNEEELFRIEMFD